MNSTNGLRTQLAVTNNDPSIVYAVITNSSDGLGGIYKSTDSGVSFVLVYDDGNLLGWECGTNGSSGQGYYDLCIIADPNQANTVFVGGINTWMSADGGINWSISNHYWDTCGGDAEVVHADKHYFAYQNGSSTLFECNDGGLYSTSDAGETWSHLGSGLITSQTYRVSVAQTNPTDVVIGLQDNGTKNLFSGSWDDVYGGDGMQCRIDYTDNNTQYCSLPRGTIQRTFDHWVSVYEKKKEGAGAWITPYVIDPNINTTLFAGYKDIWKSLDQGENWQKISDWGVIAGPKLRSLVVASSNSNTIYTATFDVLYTTTDGGISWSEIIGDLPVGSSNITRLSVKNDDPNTL